MDNRTRVESFLREDDWNFAPVDGRPIFRVGFAGNSGTWTAYISAADDGVISVCSMLDQAAPSDRRMEVAELLTRVNYGLRLGGFQLDIGDGEIRFYSAIDVEGGDLTFMMFKNLLYNNLMTTDHYFKAIMAVCFAGVGAESAYEAAAAEQ